MPSGAAATDHVGTYVQGTQGVGFSMIGTVGTLRIRNRQFQCLGKPIPRTEPWGQSTLMSLGDPLCPQTDHWFVPLPRSEPISTARSDMITLPVGRDVPAGRSQPNLGEEKRHGIFEAPAFTSRGLAPPFFYLGAPSSAARALVH